MQSNRYVIGLEFVVKHITIYHLAFHTESLLFVTFYLEKRPSVVPKFALEIAFVNAAAATADISQTAGITWGEIINRCLQVELMALGHKWFYRLSADISITINLRDAITIVNLAIGTNGDPAKATVAFDEIRGVSLHEVIILSIGI